MSATGSRTRTPYTNAKPLMKPRVVCGFLYFFAYLPLDGKYPWSLWCLLPSEILNMTLTLFGFPIIVKTQRAGII